ncbi:hypothetical protein NKR23_g2397 [Pleurostoma richardsiae]|uniref:Uncharacterized protein n=1 Tax=Pleurostoma richardsiae TaxID=41990 RepID=A0AA38RXB4_9PEZI|nr:hypothetical protein NKR23_g2397 [Pleurostoma richardsiae]
MASLAAACRLSARLAKQRIPHDAAVRGFRTSTASLAAQNFTMPALSPTMTEGGIASWQVKEGEKFAAGDVLLEIETDKATMDVEAQEDGILMKIMKGDGSKGVPVGTRIAVIAEAGDDISSLEIPPDESPKTAAPAEAAPAPQIEPEPRKTEEKPTERAKEVSPAEADKTRKTHNKKYPLLPSVAHLLHERGIDESKVDEISATGPRGQLLKGDVLAYIGTVSADLPAGIEARFEKQSHLDLSNVKTAPKKAVEPAKEAKASVPTAATKTPPVPQDILVTVPVTLSSVVEVQKKVQDTLGVFLPLSTFIARATDLANDELPRSAAAKPSADELFNQVLGLDKVSSRGSRGHYLPQISALSPPPAFSQRAVAPRKPDIIDILAGGSRKKATAPKQALAPSVSAAGINLFSLKVPKAEEKRARVFLERVKLVLENDPGRLVI